MEAQIDPREAGLDPDRLDRLDSYLRRFVDSGQLPGWQLVVTRGGSVAHASSYGLRHRERSAEVGEDTLFRIYSMTKPIVSVAAMMLYEQGEFQLSDPVSDVLPAFAGLSVYRGGSDLRVSTSPATETMRMGHLLTHTSGLTYGFIRQHPVDALYRANGLDGAPSGLGLEALCDRLATLPLMFEPGTRWAYSMASDVLGRVVEVLSGKSLGSFLGGRIFEPLGMADTRFGVDESSMDRLMRLYSLTSAGLEPADHLAARIDHPDHPGGGGGLISSANDYHRFTQMLLRRGELDGRRLLGRATVDFMTRNHLPGDVDLATYGPPLYSESPMRGIGFGLGVSVDLDAAAAGRPGSPGTYGWGGMAGTRFWVDPAEELTALFFTQALTSTPLAVREGLRQMVYQALV